MHLAWGPEEEAFRAELVAFLEANTPPEVLSRSDFAVAIRRAEDTELSPAVGPRLAGQAVRPRVDDPRLSA